VDQPGQPVGQADLPGEHILEQPDGARQGLRVEAPTPLFSELSKSCA